MKNNYSLLMPPEAKSAVKKNPIFSKIKFFYLLIALSFSLGMQAQADCSDAVIVCGNTQSFNPSGVGSKLEQLACGGIEHNSIWVAFQAKASGKLNFVIRPTTLEGVPVVADFDWSLFALAGAPGTANCDAKTQLSCNFAGTATVFGIPGATGMATPNYVATQFNPGIDVVSGNWYTIIVDQFSNTTPLLFSIQFTGNTESPNLNSTPGIFDNKPDFAINTSSGCNGAYTFTNNSVATGGIASYLWDFGDGNTSTATSPSHTYATTGTYYVTLTTTMASGCKSDIRKQLSFNMTPPAINTAGILNTPSCTDSNSGSLTISTMGATNLGVTGGTAPYTFELVSPSTMTRPSQSSNSFTGLQAGNYTIKVTDACGRTATASATVAQIAGNSTIGLGIQNIQSACGTLPTGTATLFANGTVPPYTMALVNSSPVLVSAQTSVLRDPVTATYYTTFVNLLPGVYTVEATDGCGKIRRATFTVTQSTAPTATAVQSPSCAGSATGTLNVTATAATGLSANGSPGSYQYALIAPSPVTRAFQNSSVFENLFPGVYTIAVKDACGNIGTSNVSVATAVAPTFGTHFTTLSCPNFANGTIESQIATVGGGAPFSFELIAPSPVLRASQSSNTFIDLPAGLYTVRLTDACGTSVTSTATVGSATAPSFTTVLTPSCTNATGTSVIVPAVSGNGPYTFELISPGSAIRPIQGSNIANSENSIFTGLDQGSYTVRMKDGCGVSATGVFTIGSPTALAFPTGSTAITSCASGSNGQLTIAQPTTGSAPYLYEIIAPSPVIVPTQSGRVFNNLPVGNYTVRITDNCGTQVTIAAPIVIGTATAPALSVTTTASCAVSNGTITCLTATANQGGGPYQYALIAPSPTLRPNQASPFFTGLQSGTYTVQITDQCGLTGTVTTTIAPAGAFTPAAGGSVVSCNGANYNGQIIVTSPQNYTPGGPILPGSGGGPYTYALYDAANTTLIAGPQASNIFSVVTPASGTPTHTIRVTDICGNTSTVTVTINAPVAISNATITATTLSCTSSNTGVIRVTTVASGGLPPYSYSLINATTTAVVAGPQTGTVFNDVPANASGYFVRVTDACGSVTTSTTALLFPAAAIPTATAATLPSCASSSTGRITVTPGTGSTLAGGTFSYSLYNAANTASIAGPQASPVFSNVGAATYTVRITDRCGIVGTAPATVTSTIATLTAAGVATGSCNAGTNGVITASSTGGSLPVSYTLVNQTTTAVIVGPQANNVFSGLASGTYIVRVIDACGTITDSATITVNILATVPTITTSTSLDCGGTAILAGFPSGGNGGPYTYAICNGSGCTSFGTYAASNTFTVTASGTYVISAKDLCGNSVNSANIVVTIPTKPIITNVAKTISCGATTITPTVTGITDTPYYSLDNANFSPTLGTIAPGTHTLRVSNYNAGVVGCASDVFSFTVNAIPAAPAVTATQTFCSGTNPTVANLAATGTGIKWYDASTLGNLLPPGTALVNGNSYYASQTVSSCESTRTAVAVTVATSTTTGSVTTTACDSYTWPANGVTYTTNQTNLTHVVGCNTATLNLTITPSTTNGSVTTTECGSYTWPANGVTYTTNQTNLTHVVGCNTATLNLTITPNTTNGSVTTTECGSYTWPANGVTYSTNQTNLAHVVGCNTATLNLTITPNTTNGSVTTTECGSYTWPANGVTYTTNQTNLTHVVGCNTATLNLTITPNTTNGSVTTTACGSYTWPANGVTYTTNQTNLTHVVGCNTATLNLTITPNTTTGSVTTTECGSYTWPANGVTYTTNQTNLTHVLGCNTATLNLTITPSATNGSVTTTECGSYTWPANGVTYTTNQKNLTHVVGCNTATLNLTITPNTTNGSVTTTECGSYTWPANGVTYTTNQTNLTHVVGCNTATLNLTIINATMPTGNAVQTFTVVDLNDATIASLVVSPSNVIWYGSLADAQSGDNPLSSSTVIANGSTYWAVTIVGTCRSTPFSVTVNVTLGTDGFENKTFAYYPNPTSSVLHISYSNIISKVQVINMIGQEVFVKNMNGLDVKIDLSALPEATYILKVTSENKTKTVKIIKKE